MNGNELTIATFHIYIYYGDITWKIALNEAKQPAAASASATVVEVISIEKTNRNCKGSYVTNPLSDDSYGGKKVWLMVVVLEEHDDYITRGTLRKFVGCH